MSRLEREGCQFESDPGYQFRGRSTGQARRHPLEAGWSSIRACGSRPRSSAIQGQSTATARGLGLNPSGARKRLGIDTAGCPPLRRVKWTSAPPPARTRLGPIGLGGRISALRHCVAIQSRDHCAFCARRQSRAASCFEGEHNRTGAPGWPAKPCVPDKGIGFEFRALRQPLSSSGRAPSWYGGNGCSIQPGGAIFGKGKPVALVVGL